MQRIESEKTACLHRPCYRPAPWCKIELVRTHSEVTEEFDSISLLKLLFLIRNWHCWSLAKWHPTAEKKTMKTTVFRHRWRAWKVVWLNVPVHQLPMTPRNWRCYGISLFSTLSFDISMKNTVQRWYSLFQGLFRVKIRKMALEAMNFQRST